MDDNVTPLRKEVKMSSDMEERLHPEDGTVKFLWWVVSRALFGPFLVLHAAGMLHLDVSQDIPNLSVVQSATLTFALMVVAFFFRH